MLFNTVFKDKVVDEYAGFVDHRLYIIFIGNISLNCVKTVNRATGPDFEHLLYTCTGAFSSKKSSSRVARPRTRKFVNSSSVFPLYSSPRT